MDFIRCEFAKNNLKWLDYVVKLINDEWVKGDILEINKRKEKVLADSSINPYILLNNNIPVGCFLIVNNDIKGYPLYSPNLACVCIEKKYRGKGYSRHILKYSLDKFKEMKIKEAYLKTKLKGFYEKAGWKPLNEFCNEERIYKVLIR